MDFFEEFTGKGSCVIILFKNNKILLQLRDEHAPTAANKWSFFGGGIDKGESPKEAIIRECKEELEYNLQNPNLCLVRKHLKHPLFDTEFIFVEPYNNQTLKPYNNQTLNQKEGKDKGWFTFEQALQLDMVNDKKVLLSAIFSFIKCYY